MRLLRLFLSILLTVLNFSASCMKRQCNDETLPLAKKPKQEELNVSQGFASPLQVYMMLNALDYDVGLRSDTVNVICLILFDFELQLLTSQIDCSDRTKFYQSVMSLISSHPHSELLIPLVINKALQDENKSILEITDSYAGSVLHLASLYGSFDCAKFFLTAAKFAGGDTLENLLLSLDFICTTGLHSVCCHDYLKCAELLIEWTKPLGDDVLKRLLEQESTVFNLTALGCARRYGSTALVDLLEPEYRRLGIGFPESNQL